VYFFGGSLSISQVVLKMKIQEVRKRNKKDDKDNISEFPDHVLLHIMSLMDTKSAVRTCVLSKRWKDLCKRLTNLTFSSSIGSCKHSMIQFLSWILSIRDHSYSLLNLSIDNHKAYIKPEVIDCVVKYALFHNVQQLKLVSCTETEPNLEPLTSIFCSQSLKSLELAIILDTLGLIFPKSLHMHALKSLNLSYVRFTTGENGDVEPFSNCHVLNTLVLRHCSFYNDQQILCISNPALSSLTIYEGKAYQISLATPNLNSFTLKGSISHQLFSTCNLSFLREVNIFIYGDGSSWNGKSSIIIKWLQVLANVKILTFTLRAFRVILQVSTLVCFCLYYFLMFMTCICIHIMSKFLSYSILCFKILI